ncbi:MAG: glycosyltransferase [Lachnospiraceae bacterium]|nr:glycosyltransferase [Lachnospiraceae bacterium]
MENNMLSPTIDIIIPTYKPGKKFSRLLTMLGKQSYPIGKIIVINTEQRYWNQYGYQGIPNLEVHHIKKKEFDHGGTRHWAVSFSQADLVLFLTDDAVPADSHLVEQLVKGFQKRGTEGELPAMVYARQLPDRDCGYSERYTRNFNYPDESRVKTRADIPKLGIKTYFGSNVCCAYDRQIYEGLGGFIRHTIFNEDMIFAGNAIQAGYAVVYQAEARVIHSHNYSCMQQFHRNFDLAVSQTDHPEIFEGLPSEREGVRLVKKTARYLIGSGHPWLLPSLIVKSGFKYLGYLTGKHYQRLPRKVILWCTMNRDYWEKAGDEE